jgi:hypothetical protein
LEREPNGNWRAQPRVIRTLAVDTRSGTTLHESQIDKAAEMNYGLESMPPRVEPTTPTLQGPHYSRFPRQCR